MQGADQLQTVPMGSVVDQPGAPLKSAQAFCEVWHWRADRRKGDSKANSAFDACNHAIGRWNTSSSHMQPISSISAVNWGDLTILGMNEIGMLGVETSDGFALDPFLSQTTIE